MSAFDVYGKIFVAGHRGLVGSAVVRRLQHEGAEHLLLRTHAELDLTDQAAVDAFFAAERPEYVFLCAARVGGKSLDGRHPVPIRCSRSRSGDGGAAAAARLAKLLNARINCAEMARSPASARRRRAAPPWA